MTAIEILESLNEEVYNTLQKCNKHCFASTPNSDLSLAFSEIMKALHLAMMEIQKGNSV